MPNYFQPTSPVPYQDFVDAEFERLNPRKALPGQTPRALPGQAPRALPPGQPRQLGPGPRALPPGVPAQGARALPPGSVGSMGIAGLLGLIMSSLGGDVSQDARRFYEERDQAENAPMTPPNEWPQDFPQVEKPELAPEPGVSDAGDGRYTFRLGRGAFNEPVFTDRPEGMTYRPGAADEASNQFKDFIRDKYGADYLNERTVGTPEWQAGGATSLGYSQLLDKVLTERPPNMMSILENITNAQEERAQRQAASEQEFYKRTQAIDKPLQERRQGENISRIIGKMLGLDVSGINPEHTKILAQILGEKRAQRGEEFRERGEARQERALTLRETKPPAEATVNGLAQQLLNNQGLVAEKIQGAWHVFAGPNESTPLRDSPKRWAAARQAATEILMKRQ